MLREGSGGLYKAPTKEEGEWLKGERDTIKFIDFRFEWGKASGFRKGKTRH